MCGRPIYRWKSFWLGAFVVCSLAWGWWDSMRFQTAAVVVDGEVRFGAIRREGATYLSQGSVFLVLYRGWHRDPVDDALIPEVFLGAVVRVPDAVVLGSFLSLWRGWLVWHGRREKCRVSSETAPN